MPNQQEQEDAVLSAARQLAHSVNSGREVVTAMSVLVDTTSRLALADFDYWERLLRWEFSQALEASIPPKWKFRTRPAPFLTWIDLCSGDGFKREKTLRTLSGPAPNGFFFALAARRLNDWVPQVRQVAREKLPIIALDSDPEHIVDVLCAILPHWNSWGRMEDEDRQVLLEIISTKKVARALKSRIIRTASGPMTSILAQAARTEALDRYLSEIAINAIQPSVRAKAYRCQLEGRTVWLIGRKWVWTDKRWCEGRIESILGERSIVPADPFLETLRLALVDNSPMVRRVAGEALIRESKSIGSDSIRFARLLASDSSPSVAERGIFALKQLETPA